MGHKVRGMPVEIRPARGADTSEIQRVARRAWTSAQEPVVGSDATEEYLAKSYDADAIRAAIADDEEIHTVAAEDAVVGFALVLPTDREGIFYIAKCFVDPERWGEGVGTRLLADLESRVLDRGGDQLSLTVMADNDRGVAFFERRGYERIETFRDEEFGVQTHGYAKPLADR
jgi:ribosomal protein S18 acetylase RimI-like enzyme